MMLLFWLQELWLQLIVVVVVRVVVAVLQIWLLWLCVGMVVCGYCVDSCGASGCCVLVAMLCDSGSGCRGGCHSERPFWSDIWPEMCIYIYIYIHIFVVEKKLVQDKPFCAKNWSKGFVSKSSSFCWENELLNAKKLENLPKRTLC